MLNLSINISFLEYFLFSIDTTLLHFGRIHRILYSVFIYILFYNISLKYPN